jgi:hypothetical protein
MRYDVIISILLIAGIAVFSVSRRSRSTPMDAKASPHKETVEKLRDIYRRSRQRIAVLRKERRRIIDDFAKKADALRAAKVKKQIDTI